MGRREHVDAVVAAMVPLVAAGCGGDIGPFPEEACVFTPGRALDVAPAEADYVAIRDVEIPLAMPDQITSRSTRSAWGEACAGATDEAACLMQLENLERGDFAFNLGPASPIGPVGDTVTHVDFVFTTGDQAAKVDSPWELIDLLLPIDTPDEAYLAARAQRQRAPCSADEGNVRRDGATFVVRGERGTVCGGDGIYEVELVVDPATGLVTLGDEVKTQDGETDCAVPGRRPDGLEPLDAASRRPESPGAYFAFLAHFEAASVPAFAHLAAELRAHGAPARLVDACHRARADEIHHARITAALAHAYGARPVAPRVRPRPLRSLFEVALDNATEGCVGETFGAALAFLQARRASDARVRRAMARIATDETRHAALSWAIHRWIRTRLGVAERHRLDRARDASAGRLIAGASHPWAKPVRTVAGVPDVDTTVRLAATMGATLWPRAA